MAIVRNEGEWGKPRRGCCEEEQRPAEEQIRDWLESSETIWALGWSGGRGRVVQPYVRNDDDDDGGWLAG